MSMQFFENRRLNREFKTVGHMIGLYCRHQHKTPYGLCDICEPLMGYTLKKLRECPFQGNKPPCLICNIHCYRPDMREQVRHVMRFAGPRMIWSHPVLTLAHLIDRLRKPVVHGDCCNS